LAIELIHSAPPPATERQLLRLYNDTQSLRAKLTRGEARSAYEIIERARDNLSAVLDRADGKNGDA
jgi:hypothetical protein